MERVVRRATVVRKGFPAEFEMSFPLPNRYQEMHTNQVTQYVTEISQQILENKNKNGEGV